METVIVYYAIAPILLYMFQIIIKSFIFTFDAC